MRTRVLPHNNTVAAWKCALYITQRVVLNNGTALWGAPETGTIQHVAQASPQVEGWLGNRH